jgi:hypothetical protein
MTLPSPLFAIIRSCSYFHLRRLLALPLFLGSITGVTAQINDVRDLRQFLTQNTGSAMVNSSPQAPSPTPRANTFYASPGPWGKLRCSYIYLEAPNSLVQNFPLPNTRSRWSFPESMLSSLPEFFRKASLSEALINLLMSSDQMVTENGFVHVFPPLPDLEAISPESRAFIYTELSKYPPNEFCADPVLIVGQTVGEWYRTSKLRPALIAKIEQMAYKRGDTIAFSDVAAILNYAESDSEARTIFKAFTRTRSLMIKVEVDHNTNLEELVGYWTLGMGLRRKDIEPLVQSVIDTDGVEAMPLSHLLPSLVRKLMYTYPGLDLAKHGMLPDCHWTSLNFFNYEPHEYLLDSRLATSAVLENFKPVEPPYKYGDILFFLSNSTGDAYHSCVHLADGIVFTKNGRNLLSPWLLMKLEDVGKIYLYKGEGRIQGFRRNNPEESIPNQ